jgi:hypothetical protein
MSAIAIRAAGREDAGTLLRLIRELAAFERLSDKVRASEADLLREGFGAWPRFEALLAEESGRALGFALFFHNFSTFEGRSGIFLETSMWSRARAGAGSGASSWRTWPRLPPRAAARGWICRSWIGIPPADSTIGSG